MVFILVPQVRVIEKSLDRLSCPGLATKAGDRVKPFNYFIDYGFWKQDLPGAVGGAPQNQVAASVIVQFKLISFVPKIVVRSLIIGLLNGEIREV